MVDIPYASATPAPNALELIGSLAKTQNAINESRLFNATMAARQKAGKIIAGAPSVEDAAKALLSDPEITTFAPNVVQDMMTTQNSMIDAAGKVSVQAFDAYGHALQGLAAAVNDPSAMAAVKANTMALASPFVREQVGKSFDTVSAAISATKDPAERLRLINGWVTANGSGEIMKHVLGTGVDINVGDRVVGAVKAPPAGGPLGEKPGALTEANALATSLAPTLGAAESFAAGGGGRDTSPLSSPNSLVPSAPPSVGALTQPKSLMPNQAPGPSAGVPTSAQPAPAPEAAPARIAGDGKPLFPADYTPGKPRNWGNIGNVPVGPDKIAIDNAVADWSKTGPEKLNNSQRTQALLTEFDSALDAMQQAGGFTSPGAGATQRVALANIANTISSVFGGEPIADPTAVAAGESGLKVSQLMTYSTLNQMMGEQREAAETIKNAMRAVPGIDNTYLGGKIISSILAAGSKRMEDEYYFKEKWKDDHQGDLTKATGAFNRAHPAENYTKSILDNFGLNEKGFKSFQALEDQYRKGFLTAKQAAEIARKQGLKPGEEK